MPFRHTRAFWLALALIAAAVAPTVSAQVVIRERVEVRPAESAVLPTQNSTASGTGWSFTQRGTLRLVLFPESSSGGTYIEQCYPSLSHTLEFKFSGSRSDEVMSVEIGGFINDIYEYAYFECPNYYAYGFAETTIELGEVQPGDEVTVDKLVSGSFVARFDSATYPDEMYATAPPWTYWRVPLESGAVRDVTGADSGVAFWEGSSGIGPVYVDFVPAPALTLSIDRDSILVTEAAQVTVEGVTDPEAVITLSAATPHGRLVRVAGADTTEVAGPLVWSEVESSELLFVADGEWPEANATVTISGALSDGEADTGILTVLAPALRLDLDVDPGTYLPVKDDTLTATIHLDHLPDGLRPSIDVALVQDYEFTFLDGTTGSSMVPLSGDSVSVRLLSKQWWGVATLRAMVQGRTPSDTLSAKIQVPIDTDGDTIADIWELDPMNGGTLALGSISRDEAWNEETSSGNFNNGDAFTKLQEYQGVLIGDNHHRLIPIVKEVFFDVRNSSAGAFVVSEVQSQLGVKVYSVDGVINDTGSSIGPTVPGTAPLQFIAPGTTFRSSMGVVFVLDAVNNAASNGLVISGGIWAATGSTTPPGPPPGAPPGTPYPLYSVAYGFNTGTAAGSGGVARCFVNTIDNVWNNNSIPETASLDFPVGVSEFSGPATWYAAYSNSDLNGDSDTNDALNPFDIAAAAAPPNNLEDSVVATLTQQQMVDYNTLHEVGHALGMSLPPPPGGNHPQRGDSVMRSGPGPSKTGTFSADDIKQMDLN